MLEPYENGDSYYFGLRSIDSDESRPADAYIFIGPKPSGDPEMWYQKEIDRIALGNPSVVEKSVYDIDGIRYFGYSDPDGIEGTWWIMAVKDGYVFRFEREVLTSIIENFHVAR